ncbi:MAG TPA: endonuclease domain-containing protein [Rhizomicrobium sp.]
MRVPEKTLQRARELRRRMTLPEVVLWDAVRRGGLARLRFRRQHPVGPYVLDFYLPSAHLAIEIDGSMHDSSAQAEHDERRTAWLARRGVTVLRVAAQDILCAETLERVLLGIEKMAAPSTAFGGPPPPLRGGGA